jgi:hypothetical protein
MKKTQRQSDNIIDVRDHTSSIPKSQRKDLMLDNIEIKKNNKSRQDYIDNNPTPKNTPFKEQIDAIEKSGKQASEARKKQIAENIGDLSRTRWNGDSARHRGPARSTTSGEGDLKDNDPYTTQPRWQSLPDTYTSQVTPGEWRQRLKKDSGK